MMLTPKQAAALDAIAPLLDQNKKLRVKALAQKIGMRPAALSAHLDLFLKLGYIERIRVGEYRWRCRPTHQNLPPPEFKPAIVGCPHCGRNVLMPPGFGTQLNPKRQPVEARASLDRRMAGR